MSLLEDVSIVVTPNGYKAGTLYGVLPTYAEGIDLVDNGDFSDGLTGWVGNPETTLSVSNNELDIQSASGGGEYGAAFSEVNFELGKQYIVQLTVVSCDVPSHIRVGGKTSATGYGGNIWGSGDIGIGTHSKVYTPTQNYTYLSIGGRNDVTTLVIDNVSVKEVTSSDMDVTRETAATRVDEDGLIEDVLSNVPRIDYTGGGCPHILAEPERTNTITYSEEISLSTGEVNQGTGSDNTVTDNYGISPDGTQNATRLVASSATGTGEYSLRNFVLTTLAAESYTQSVYLKSNTGSNQKLSYYGRATGTRGFITVTNEWQRFELTGTSNTTNYYIYLGLRPEDGTDSSCDVLVYGLQLELGSYATSYIPNFGTSAGVTRNQDIFTRDGIGSLINSEEGVLFGEMAVLSDDSTLKSITLSDGTGGNRVIINYSNESNRLTADVRVGAVGQAFMQTYSYTITNFLKIALKYKENDFALWVNGTEVATATSGSTFSANTLNRLGLDNGVSGELFYGKVKQLQVYPSSLTDEQLKDLTT